MHCSIAWGCIIRVLNARMSCCCSGPSTIRCGSSPPISIIYIIWHHGNVSVGMSDIFCQELHGMVLVALAILLVQGQYSEFGVSKMKSWKFIWSCTPAARLRYVHRQERRGHPDRTTIRRVLWQHGECIEGAVFPSCRNSSVSWLIILSHPFDWTSSNQSEVFCTLYVYSTIRLHGTMALTEGVAVCAQEKGNVDLAIQYYSMAIEVW